ncbi:DUF3717 domain-containing protein [Burkholderia vietnamiensis]|uniref:DUF3717 domain-containing protein n=1 Tax=Burkholderia vietnamiensis TaxID=60552 RepID=UPI001CF1C87E|nr:DUF3717 domain-containing protein [Burkholderia vietnamiensis]MCA8270717.1 DUF3717 domain-containing protein [Burkholderia vietnamiensis]
MPSDTYSISELEIAINYWRERFPSRGDELALCPEASALATLYASMIVHAQQTFSFQEQNGRVRAALDAAYEVLQR